MSEEEFVISGFSARFPQADNLVEFKKKLYAGVDLVTDDEARWPRGHLGTPERMGTIRDLTKFDAHFFGVHPKQAHQIDAQVRLLLETTYEAIVDAGYDPETMRGRSVGVFIGTFYVESEEAINVDPDKIEGYGPLGTTRALFSNRISYSFDFKGPSVTVDTACSSTMIALNHALLALRSGQCDAAIVGGSGIFLKPATTLSFLRLGALSLDGKCKSFDASASGYVRSETVGVFLIQRASEARRVYAKLLHVKANVDGYKTEGITVPSGKMQEKLLREVYTEAKVDPVKVRYVEAHGTGTPVGDPQEVSAFRNVFCAKGRQTPLKIGAVKSNMGHSEAASGVCSVAKVILAMESGIIAANLHFKNPNPDIPSLFDGSVEVVKEATPFPGGPVGINSSGFGGANAHVILEANPGPHVNELPRERAELPRLVLLAGRSKESLERTMDLLVAEGPHPDSAYTLLNLVGQPSTKLFPFRSHVTVPIDRVGKETVKAAVERSPLERRPLWFVFSGVGSQWTGMGRQMMQFDVFSRSLRKSHQLLTQFGIDLIGAVTEDTAGKLDLATSLASITAIQVALVDMLLAVGVKADGMLGHSLGEIACAYSDECFTAEQAVLCSYWRGRCIDLCDVPKGAMAAVGLTWEEARKRCRDGVVPACHNAQDSVTVSGSPDAVAALVQDLKAQNVFARNVDSSGVAFHSEDMHCVGPPLLERLKEVVPTPKLRSHRWVCTSLPEARWQEPCAVMSSAEYHVNNVLSPVLFYEALQHVPKEAVVIDIGPHCLMMPLLRRALGSEASCVGLMKRHEDNVPFFLGSLGKLHTLGVKLDLSPLYPPVPLPVPRGTPSIAHLVSWDHSETWNVPHWSDFYTLTQSSEKVTEVDMEANAEDAYLAGHQIDGRVLFPAAGYVMLAWKFLAKRVGKPFDELPVVLEDITFHRAVIMEKSRPVRFCVSILRTTGEFEISEGGTVVSSGRIRSAEEDQEHLNMESPTIRHGDLSYELETEDIYKELRLRGYEYGNTFQGIIKADMKQPYGKIKWEGNWVTFMDAMLQLSILDTPQRTLRLPVGIQRCWIYPSHQMQSVENSQDTGIDAAYEEGPMKCQAGGIVMDGIKLGVAPRRPPEQNVSLNEYKFVPYTDQESTKSEREASIREYIEVCNSVARQLPVLSSKDKEGILLELNATCEPSDDVVLRYHDTEAENQGLLTVLTTVQNEANIFSLEHTIQSAISSYKHDLQKDRLNTALFDEDPLRHLLDIVVENTSIKKLHVVEVAISGSGCLVAPTVCNFLPLSNVLLDVDYTVAHTSSESFDTKQVPEGVRVISFASKSQVKAADLVIIWVPTTDEESFQPVFQEVSTICKSQGFVLVAHRTRLAPAEMLLSAVGNVKFSVHSVEEMESAFRLDGFSLVGRKSNNLAALQLLRKTALFAEGENKEIITVSNEKHDWIETLKHKARGSENKPIEEKIWLVAEDRCTSGVVGLTNCLRREVEENRIRCMFDASLNQAEEQIELNPSNPALKDLLALDLVMNVYRNGEWGSFRLSATPLRGVQKTSTEFAFLSFRTQGGLSCMQWQESPLVYEATDDRMNICSVHYAPIISTDLTPEVTNRPSDTWRGLREFSGRDCHGRRVMGLVTTETVATKVAVNTGLVWEVTDTWSLAEGATVPLAYVTAYYALLVRGHMRAGESLLVHLGSGAVGQAAISVALFMGCTVFTTVESQEEREFLTRRFPILEGHIGSSRDLSFEQLVFLGTKGKGVDLMLNTLPQDKMQGSVRCLAARGRFLEIGKANSSEDTFLDISMHTKSICFQNIMLKDLLEDSPLAKEERQQVVALVREGIDSGAVRPLDSIVFSLDNADKAFQLAASGNNTGAVILEIRPEESERIVTSAKPLVVEAVRRTYFYKHKSYVIIGGLGGFGLELADWMVSRGCRYLLLTSRSGVRTGYQKLCIRRWQQAGVKIITTTVDASTRDGAEEIIAKADALGPVGGIFNLGVILRDGLLENQTVEALETTLSVKINATEKLDIVSRSLCPQLDHFVCFSSMSACFGNIGQTSYGYGNSAMERICEYRAANGLPALAIQWGPVADVGVFREIVGDDVVVSGTTPQRISACLSVMDHLFCQGRTVVNSFVKADLTTTDDSSRKPGLLDSIQRIFGVKDPSSLNPNVNLRELGMDSLMAVEVKQTIERECDFTLTMPEIARLTFNDLIKMSERRGAGKLESGNSTKRKDL